MFSSPDCKLTVLHLEIRVQFPSWQLALVSFPLRTCHQTGRYFLPSWGFITMLSSVPSRLIARRSRSLSPCSRVLQTSVKGGANHGIRETQAESNRNPIVSTSRVSRRGLLADETAGACVKPLVQYHHLAPRWLSNLEIRRSSWAALATRGRNSNQYWEESGRNEGDGGKRAGGGAGLASAGALSAAALAFCLRKDSDNKGKLYNNFINHFNNNT